MHISRSGHWWRGLLRGSCVGGGQAWTDIIITLNSGASPIGTVYGGTFNKDWIYPLKLEANEAFVMQATTADQIYGQVCYWVESIDNL